jgi:hypothetical protein
MSRMSRGLQGASIAFLLGALGVRAAAQPTASIYVQYDGYVKQPDGSFVLSFGYFNQNNVDVTVNAGDANGFTPGPADRNQPLRFAKGRHRFSCAMVVDKTFDGRLQWTVKFAGKSSTTTAKTLDPLYELELNSEKRVMEGLDVGGSPKNVCVNRAPAVHMLSPLGEHLTSASGRVGQDVLLNGQVEDDGLPRDGHVTIAWKKISGPGDVTFTSPATGPTRATFSAAGDYELELSATDGEKRNAAKITVHIS